MNIFVLTGAGVSAESGVPTFRDADGLWERHRIEEVATPEGFRRDPALVRQFYNERRRALAGVAPNAAHRALAQLEAELPRQGGTLYPLRAGHRRPARARRLARGAAHARRTAQGPMHRL